MAELHKITKNNKRIIEDLDLLGIGQNLKDTSKPTTLQLRIEFKRKDGTKISFMLHKDEVEFIKKEVNKF